MLQPLGCPGVVLLLFLIMGFLTFAPAQLGGGENPVISATPAPTATPSPPGDMGFCEISGTVSAEDGGILSPRSGVEVSYDHHSYVRSGSSGQTVTDENGHFAFDPILIHDTDTIIVQAEFPGYEPQRIMRGGMETWPACQFDILLIRETSTQG
jgi:hypothetical protein